MDPLDMILLKETIDLCERLKKRYKEDHDLIEKSMRGDLLKAYRKLVNSESIKIDEIKKVLEKDLKL